MINPFCVTGAADRRQPTGKEAKATGEKSGFSKSKNLSGADSSLEWHAFCSLFKGKQFAQRAARKRYVPLCDNQG